MTVSFDLIRDPWVAAIRRDGTPVTLSLVDLFAQSAELLDITYIARATGGARSAHAAVST